MPMPSDRVELLVAGHAHGDWERYCIESDLLTPADAWSVSLGVTGQGLPAEVVEGAEAEVRVGGERAMIGHIDEINEPIGKHEHSVSLAGRDGAAILVDCSAPIFVRRKASLAEITAALTRDLLKTTRIRIDADQTRIREKINVEPGDTAWDALRNAAESNGLWPWFEPDGTLVIGGPDYSTPPVATLILRRDGKGNNVENFTLHKNIQNRFSEVTVYGQTHGTEQEEGKHNLHATWKDTGVTWYRPKVVVDHEADSPAVCRDRARKLVSDSRLEAFTLTATVKGHRIIAPGQTANGKLWTPGQRVYVKDEVHRLDGIFFLMGRKFLGGRSSGATSELTLKEDGVWVLDAHPHKRKHRRGKNAIMEDYTGPSA